MLNNERWYSIQMWQGKIATNVLSLVTWEHPQNQWKLLLLQNTITEKNSSSNFIHIFYQFIYEHNDKFMSILEKEILARVQFSLQNDKEPYYVIAIYKLGNAISFWALSMMASEILSPSRRYNIFGSFPTFTLKLFCSS